MRLLTFWLFLFLSGMITLVPEGGIFAQQYIPVMKPENIQHNLQSDEVMLEYSLTDSSVLVTALAVDSTLFASQSLNPLFWTSLESFRKKLRSADPNEFSILGQVLYLFLVKPVEDFLTGKRRLIIIPDSRLSGLPFEAFEIGRAHV